jgi:hypothetical protein
MAENVTERARKRHGSRLLVAFAVVLVASVGTLAVPSVRWPLQLRWWALQLRSSDLRKRAAAAEKLSHAGKTEAGGIYPEVTAVLVERDVRVMRNVCFVGTFTGEAAGGNRETWDVEQWLASSPGVASMERRAVISRSSDWWPPSLGRRMLIVAVGQLRAGQPDEFVRLTSEIPLDGDDAPAILDAVKRRLAEK